MTNAFDADDCLTFGNVPDQQYFELPENGDWIQPFVLQDYNQATGTRVPHNLTGAAMRMQLKAVPAPPAQYSPSEAVALDISTANGKITIASDATTGAFNFNVPASELWTMGPGSYIGDLLIFEGAAVTPAFTARVYVRAGVTPPTES